MKKAPACVTLKPISKHTERRTTRFLRCRYNKIQPPQFCFSVNDDAGDVDVKGIQAHHIV